MDPSNEENAAYEADQKSPPRKEGSPKDQRVPRPKASKISKPTANNPTQRGGSPPQEENSHNVRQAFQTALSKISQNETRDIGLKEIQGIISANNAPTHLRIYFSCLRDQKRQFDSTTKELELLVFSYIASVFKKNLLDPLDKPPNLIKSVVRLCEYIHSYFKDTSTGVQIACGKALREIYLNCIEDENTEIVALIMIEPLYSILNGGADRATQHTAAYCFNEILKIFEVKNKSELLEIAASRLYSLFLKTNHEFQELLESIAFVIFKVGITYLQGKFNAFADKLCHIIESKNGQNQYYLIKIEACGVLLAFAYALKGADLEQRVIDTLYEKVGTVLKDASKNKILKVQQAASEALKFWVVLKGGPEAENVKLELPKAVDQSKNVAKSRPENEKRAEDGSHNFKEIRNRLKQAKFEDNSKQEEGNRRGVSVEPSSGADLLNVKYGSQNRGQNFTKSRSGTVLGGGHVGWTSPKTDKKKFSYENQKKNLKGLISQLKQDGGKLRAKSVGPKDKFKFIGDEEEEDEAIQEEKQDTEENEEEENNIKEAMKKKKRASKQQSIEENEEDDRRSRGRGVRRDSEKEQEDSQQEKSVSVGRSQQSIGGQALKSRGSGVSEASNPDSASDRKEQFVEKVQKKITGSQIKSDAGVGVTRPPAKARPQTAKVSQAESKGNARREAPPARNPIDALEGKLAAVIGKSKEEVQAEINERAQANRQLKNSNQKAAEQPQKVAKKTSSFKLAEEDASLFKAIEFMDNTDLQTGFNGINEYNPEQAEEHTFGNKMQDNHFVESVKKVVPQSQIKVHAGPPNTRPPAKNTAAQGKARQPAPTQEVQFEIMAPKGKTTANKNVVEANMQAAIEVPGGRNVAKPAVKNTQPQSQTAKKQAAPRGTGSPYKLQDEDASLFKSLEFMDGTNIQSEYNGVSEYNGNTEQQEEEEMPAKQNQYEKPMRSAPTTNQTVQRRQGQNSAVVRKKEPEVAVTGEVELNEEEFNDEGAEAEDEEEKEQEAPEEEGAEEGQGKEGEGEDEEEGEGEGEEEGEGEREEEGEGEEEEGNNGGFAGFEVEDVGQGDEGIFDYAKEKLGLGNKTDKAKEAKPAEKGAAAEKEKAKPTENKAGESPAKEEKKTEGGATEEGKKGMLDGAKDWMSSRLGFGKKEEPKSKIASPEKVEKGGTNNEEIGNSKKEAKATTESTTKEAKPVGDKASKEGKGAKEQSSPTKPEKGAEAKGDAEAVEGGKKSMLAGAKDWMSDKLGLSGKKGDRSKSASPTKSEKAQGNQEGEAEETAEEKKGMFAGAKDWMSDKLGLSGKKGDRSKSASPTKNEKAMAEETVEKNVTKTAGIKGPRIEMSDTEKAKVKQSGGSAGGKDIVKKPTQQVNEDEYLENESEAFKPKSKVPRDELSKGQGDVPKKVQINENPVGMNEKPLKPAIKQSKPQPQPQAAEEDDEYYEETGFKKSSKVLRDELPPVPASKVKANDTNIQTFGAGDRPIKPKKQQIYDEEDYEEYMARQEEEQEPAPKTISNQKTIKPQRVEQDSQPLKGDRPLKPAKKQVYNEEDDDIDEVTESVAKVKKPEKSREEMIKDRLIQQVFDLEKEIQEAAKNRDKEGKARGEMLKDRLVQQVFDLEKEIRESGKQTTSKPKEEPAAKKIQANPVKKTAGIRDSEPKTGAPGKALEKKILKDLMNSNELDADIEKLKPSKYSQDDRPFEFKNQAFDLDAYEDEMGYDYNDEEPKQAVKAQVKTVEPPTKSREELIKDRLIQQVFDLEKEIKVATKNKDPETKDRAEMLKDRLMQQVFDMEKEIKAAAVSKKSAPVKQGTKSREEMLRDRLIQPVYDLEKERRAVEPQTKSREELIKDRLIQQVFDLEKEIKVATKNKDPETKDRAEMLKDRLIQQVFDLEKEIKGSGKKEESKKAPTKTREEELRDRLMQQVFDLENELKESKKVKEEPMMRQIGPITKGEMLRDRLIQQVFDLEKEIQDSKKVKEEPMMGPITKGEMLRDRLIQQVFDLEKEIQSSKQAPVKTREEELKDRLMQQVFDLEKEIKSSSKKEELKQAPAKTREEELRDRLMQQVFDMEKEIKSVKKESPAPEAKSREDMLRDRLIQQVFDLEKEIKDSKKVKEEPMMGQIGPITKGEMLRDRLVQQVFDLEKEIQASKQAPVKTREEELKDRLMQQVFDLEKEMQDSKKVKEEPMMGTITKGEMLRDRLVQQVFDLENEIKVAAKKNDTETQARGEMLKDRLLQQVFDLEKEMKAKPKVETKSREEMLRDRLLQQVFDLDKQTRDSAHNSSLEKSLNRTADFVQGPSPAKGQNLDTSADRLEQQVLEEIKYSMAGYLSNPELMQILNKQREGEKFKKVPIDRTQEGRPAIRESVEDNVIGLTGNGSFKDSLMLTRQMHETLGKEFMHPMNVESPSIDDVDNVRVKQQRPMKNSLIRAPQNIEEVKSNVRVKDVDMTPEYITNVRELLAKSRNTKTGPNLNFTAPIESDYGASMSQGYGPTRVPQQRYQARNVPERDMNMEASRNKYSTLGYNPNYRRISQEAESTETGIPEDILDEIDAGFQKKPEVRRYPEDFGRKRSNPNDMFVESTMDEQTLALYLQNEQKKVAQQSMPSIQKQVTFNPQTHHYSHPATPSFTPQPGAGGLDDTVIYASQDGRSQMRASGEVIRIRENDYMGETIKSVEADSALASRTKWGTLPPIAQSRGQESRLDNASVGEVWKDASADVAKGDYESAYIRILNSGDDIYLLRLLKLTGPCLKKLNRATAMKLLKRIIALQKSSFFEKIALGFFENAHRTRVTHNMKIEEQNLLLRALYSMSGKADVVGQTAASLHEVINIDLKTI